MGLSLRIADDVDREYGCVEWGYAGIQSYRKQLLIEAHRQLGLLPWEDNVKFFWMLELDAPTPRYADVEDLGTNPWWSGKLRDMPVWLPGLLAFVNKSDTNPTWSWGQCAEIAVMLAALDPVSRALPLFTYAATVRCSVYGR